jgi:hypothetical protein
MARLRRPPPCAGSKQGGLIEMVKQSLSIVTLCLFLLLPVSGWALDGGENWRQLSPQERENVLRNYQRWQNLPPKDKEYLREEWNRWQSLPQDRRERLRQRYDELHKLPPEQQRNLRDRLNDRKSPRPRDRDRD